MWNTFRSRVLPPAVLVLAVVGCARPGPTSTPSDRTAAAQEMPSDQKAGPPPAGVATNGAPAAPQRRPSSERSRRDSVLTVPAGTALAVRFYGPVSSATAVPGQEVSGELVTPLAVNDDVVAEAETQVRARVVRVVPSGRLGRTARLELTLIAVKLDGGWVPAATSDFVRVGQAHAKRNERLVGGGAVIGAIVGQLLGGNTKSTLRGAAAGAAAGTGAAAATGRLDVEVRAGEVLRFVLRQPLTARPS